MARDIGGYFEKLTRQGRGGRRLDGDGDGAPPRDSRRDEPTPAPEPEPSAGTSGSSLKDILGDVFGRGRERVSTTAKRTVDKARTTSKRRRAKQRTKRRRELPDESVVIVDYAPCLDGDPDPGEVVWTWVPFEEDADQGKDRPVVVIGRRGRSLVGVPLTTKRNDREAQIAIGTGDWDPKRRTSYARIWRMLDIDGDRMRREGAVLERRRFDRVTAALDEYYEVRRPARSGAGDDEFEDDH